MTGHQINSLVGDLVAMAQAMERLPQVEHERDEAQRIAGKRTDEIIRLENDLEQARTYSATLEQKVRDAEVAKDQAETMFLEADERTSRALDFIKATFGNAGSLIQALEPPRAEEPKVEPMAGTGTHEANPPYAPYSDNLGQSDSLPTSTTATSASTTETVAEPSDASIHTISPGESVADPTASTITHEDNSYQTASSGTVSSQDDASLPSSSPPSPGPYHGKRYIDIPNFCTLTEWLAGGGTEANYHYRHSAQDWAAHS